MAVSQEQKVDFLLKKLGFTKTKTGLAVDSSLTGTKKAGFAEAIPSPLVVPNDSLWIEAGSIPATPPSSDTNQVRVYLASGSGLRMTVDTTVAGNRAFIAFETYNDTTSNRLNNWIDTQFGASYLIKVFKGDPNSGGVQLSAAGSGANDGWFFDYSAGILNFNDTNVPSGVATDNIYIVGYRYIGQTGAPTPGISTFSFKDLSIERNLDVGIQGGISTFRNNIDLNGDLDVDGHTNLDNVSIAGVTTITQDLDVDGHTNLDNVSVAGVLTATSYVGGLPITDGANNRIITASSPSAIQGEAGLTFDGTTLSNAGTGFKEIKINPSTNNSATLRLQNSQANYTISNITGGSFSIADGSDARFTINSSGVVGINNDLDVDGHTNLDNVSIAGVTSVASLTSGRVVLAGTNGKLEDSNNLTFNGSTLAVTGGASFSGNVSIGGTLTYEDVKNVDAVGLITARSGIRVTGGVIEALAGENKIPSLYANLAALPSASTYHGMFAHVHSEGRGYFAHAGNWLELVNKDTSGNVGLSGDLDVDGHTNLDNVSVAGVTTFTGNIDANGDLDVDGDTQLDDLNVSGIATLGSGASGQAILEYQGTTRLKTQSWGQQTHGILQNFGDIETVKFDSTSSRNLIFKNDSGGLRKVLEIGHASSNSFITGHVGNISINAPQVSISTNFSVAGVTTFSDKINVSDNVKLTLGDGDDIQIFWNGSQGFITNQGGSNLHLNSDSLLLKNAANTKSYIRAYNNSSVELYHNNVKRLETSSVGVSIPQDLDVDGHTNLDNVSIAGVTTMSGNLTITNANPILYFIDSGANPDYYIKNNNGYFDIYDQTNVATRLSISPTGVISITGNLNVNKDLDVDGHTNLDNVSIVGVTSTSNNFNIISPSAIVDNKNLLRVSGGTVGFSGGNDANKRFGIQFDACAFNGAVVERTGARIYMEKEGSWNYGHSPSSYSAWGALVFQTSRAQSSGAEASREAKIQERLRITSTGNVGIGSSRPGSKLDVSGDVSIAGVATFASGTTFTGAIDANGDLDVDGHTNLDNVSIAGVTTFAGVAEFDNKAKFDSTIAVHDGTTGSNGQYLLSTGVGVTWGSFPTMRTSQTFTASAGQTTFSFTYNVGFLDVYVNGVKLSSSEFTANNGTSVVLAVGSFVGDIVELISFFTTSYAAGTSGLGNIVEDTTPQLGGNLDLFNKSITGTGNINITGIITATSFVGDGSGLTGVIGSGSGVVIKDSGSTVGTAGTINFGNNLSVSAISGGSVTITATGGGGGTSGINTIGGVVNIVNDLDVDGHTNLDNVSVAGVTTIASGGKLSIGGVVPTELLHIADAGNPKILIEDTNSNNQVGVRFKTTNYDWIAGLHGGIDSFKISHSTAFGSNDFFVINGAGNVSIIKDFDVDGHTELDNVNVAGVVTTSDIRSNSLNFKNAGGGATYAVFTNGGSVLLKHNNTDRLETSASGVTVTGTVAATAFSGDGSGLTGITGSGSGVVVKDNGSTVGTAGTINFGETIDVSAISGGSVTVGVSTSQFNVDKLNVSGISTFVGVTTFKDDIFLPETKSINIGNGTGIFSQIAGLVIENGFITNSGGVLNITSVSGDIRSYSSDNFSVFTNNNEQAILATKNGSVALYHDGGNKKIETSATGVTVTGTVTATAFVGDGSNLTGISGGGGTNVGITTNLSGSFTANAGSPSTINTFAYHDNDKVVEYTVYIKNGSDFQSQKLLAMRDGTTIHSTQFAVMFSSSLLVQLDATISSDGILLRATPETGVSGSTTYKIKREVM